MLVELAASISLLEGCIGKGISGRHWKEGLTEWIMTGKCSDCSLYIYMFSCQDIFLVFTY